MTGQLQDAGNTTTLAHYLDLLAGAGVLTGLPKYAGDTARRQRSSPKFQVFNTALITAQSGMTQDRGVCRPRVLGTLNRIRSRRTPAQRIRRRRVRTLLLARAQPRSGFCREKRKEAAGHRSKKRTHHHFTSRHGSVRQLLQTRSPINSRHGRHLP